MKKLILFILLFVFGWFTYAEILNSNFLVKKEVQDDKYFTDNLENIPNETDLVFRLIVLSDATWWKISIVFPWTSKYSGYVYEGTCNQNVLTDDDNWFEINFSGSSDCVVDVKIFRKVLLTWNYNITPLFLNGSKWTTLNNVRISVLPVVYLTRYSTLDLNKNWYIDSLLVSFTGKTVNLSELDKSKFMVSFSGNLLNINSISTSWDKFIFYFNDNIWWTNVLPLLKLTEYNINWKVIKLKDSVEKFDNASAIFSISPVSWTYNTGITVTANFLTETGNLYYYVNSWNYVIYTWWFYLWQTWWNYIVNFKSEDNNWNIFEKVSNYIFKCAISSVENWIVTAYPECKIICNDGYKLNWTTCVAIQTNANSNNSAEGSISSWWGWWWGWWWGRWGSRWWGWGWWWGWWTYSLPAQETKNKSTNSIFSTKQNFKIPKIWQFDDEAIKSYSNQVYSIISKIYKFKKNLVYKLFNFVYYNTDKIFLKYDVAYNQIVKQYFNSLAKFLLYAAYYKKQKSYKYKKLAKKEIVKIVNFDKKLKTYENKYFVKRWKILYPKNNKLIPVFSKLETILVWKFDKLLKYGIISNTDYSRLIDSYNKLVKMLYIYIKNKNKLDKSKLKEFRKYILQYFNQEILPYYNKKIVIKKQSLITKQLSKKSIFKRDLTLWLRWEDVKRLQQFLKMKGYWPKNVLITWYFWKITLTYLKKYLKNIWVNLGSNVVSKELLNTLFTN